MRRTPQTFSQKSRNSAQINILQDKLFSKLQKLSTQTIPLSRYQDLDHKLLNGTPDALTDLIYRAKGITLDNQDKINKAKKEIRVSKKEIGAGTFLTGTGLYTAEQQPEHKPVSAPLQRELETDADEMLKNMLNRNEQDDLAQLRRMIKIADENLGGYSRQVHKIKKDVINAAAHFKCENQMDFDLSYKLNRLNENNVGSASKINISGSQSKVGVSNNKIGVSTGNIDGRSNRKSGSLAKIRGNQFD